MGAWASHRAEPAPARLGCCWPGVLWLGLPVCVRRASLRYSTPGEETGFLSNRLEVLLSQLFLSGTVILVVSCLRLLDSVMGLRTQGAWLAIDVFQICCQGLCVVMGFAFMVVAKVPALSGRLGSAGCEVFAMGIVILVMVCVILPELHAAVALRGMDLCADLPLRVGYDPVCFLSAGALSSAEEVASSGGGRCFSNTYPVLVLSILTTALHVMLPIRWFILLWVEVAGVALYALLLFGSGTWESEARWPWYLGLFVTLTVLQASGKRQLELTERCLFSRFLAEKTLRVQREHELSRVAEGGQSGRRRGARGASRTAEPDDGARSAHSLPTTADSERAFEVPQGGGAALQTLAEIGRHEQWLVGEEELQVFPQEVLGAGGFGLVFGGSFHGTPVAIKVAKQAAPAKLLASVANELRVLRRLRHPNLVLFHGACMDFARQDVALVLEYVAGEDMESFVLVPRADGTLTSSLARCQVLLGICLALRYLHSRRPRIVHGDLKPSNVLVEQRSGSCPRLLDFGLARCLTRSAQPNGGTRRWAAPEAFGSLWSEKGGGVDVFGLGRLAYFAATRREPFGELNERAVAAMASSAQAPPLTWPSSSPLIERCRLLTERATRPDPAARTSIEEIHGELASWPESQESTGSRSGRAGGSGRQFWHVIKAVREAAKREEWVRKAAAEPRAASRAARAVEGSSLRGEPSSRRVSSVPEETAVPSEGVEAEAGEGGQSVLAGFQLTPETSIAPLILDILWRCNFPLSGSGCCPYHMALTGLSGAFHVLQREECKPDFRPWHEAQCQECLLMLPPVQESADARVRCNKCGSKLTLEL